MNREEIAKRLSVASGNAPRTPPDLQSHLPEWLFAKVMEQCHGQPSEQLTAWLEAHQHTRDDIARWHTEIQPPHWRDPQAVIAASMSIADHSMRNHLGGMLSALVGRHAPENIGYVPPEFIPREPT